MEKKMIVNRPVIEVSGVASVYSGKDGKCCCGCSGKHTYATAHRKWASTWRGYTVGDDEINDRTVKLIVGKISRSDGVEYFGDKGHRGSTRFYSVVIGKRLYVAYFKV